MIGPTDHELVVVVRPAPGVYQPGPGGLVGLDADLARLFANQTGRTLRFVTAGNATELVDRVARGRATLGVGGLLRPVAEGGPAKPAISEPAAAGTQTPSVLWTRGYYRVAPVVIYNVEGFAPNDWRDLDGDTVAYVTGAGLEPQVEKVRHTHPEVRWDPVSPPTADTLIGEVSDGRRSYAVVSSTEAALARNIHLNYDVAFTVEGRRELAWIVPAEAEGLRDELNGFLSRVEADGTLKRLVDRYYGQQGQVPRLDAGVLHERIQTLLPQFRAAFQQAQQMTGLEWRLLAAIAYQESQWDPLATSETGVRGMMQLTEETARRLGDIDRLDPRASILAAARYIHELKTRIPARIPEPDRTWFALAAFNIGLGHLEDARVLAQKQKLNPDLWSDVKKTLPLLALPEYYDQAKLGYARGGMPVAFVDRVRAYYDVLLARQPQLAPRLQVDASRGDGVHADIAPTARPASPMAPPLMPAAPARDPRLGARASIGAQTTLAAR